MCSLLLLVVAPAAALRGAPLRATTRLDYDHLYHIGSPVDVFKLSHRRFHAVCARVPEGAARLDPPLVVASFPRSGSTMVRRAVEAATGQRTGSAH